MSRTNRDHKGCSGNGRYFIGVHDRDMGHDAKPGCKPPGWYKRMRRRVRRAQDNQALRDGREAPRHRKTDEWDWN